MEYPEDCVGMYEKRCYKAKSCPHWTPTAYKKCVLLGDCPFTKDY